MKDLSFIVVVILVFAIMLACPVGYIANIIKLADCDFENIQGLTVLRVVGIFVLPLGIVLGYC